MRFRLHKLEDGTVRAERNVKETIEALKPGSYWVEIDAIRPPKTLPQLAYFHGPVLLAIADETGEIHEGMSKPEIRERLLWIKDGLKRKYAHFFPMTWHKDPFRTGKRLTKRRGMTEIDKEQCRKFLDAICLDFPYVPIPDTGKAMEFYDEMIRKFGKVSAD